MYNNYYPYGYQMSYFPATPSRDRNNTKSLKQDFNIPLMPIIGEQSQELLIKNIYQSIVDEATAAEFYYRLLQETPDELHREFVKHAYEDELEHLEAFTKLYIHLTGQEPQYRVQPVQYTNYKEGILMALKDELKAAEFYRDVKLSSTNSLVRDTFFLALVDELEHSTQFGVLYNTL